MNEAWLYEPPEINWVGPECEACGGDEFELVVYTKEHPDYSPGGNEYQCVNCSARYGRWSKRMLHGQEAERRRGH